VFSKPRHAVVAHDHVEQEVAIADRRCKIGTNDLANIGMACPLDDWYYRQFARLETVRVFVSECK
jgi:hypothetical protein